MTSWGQEGRRRMRNLDFLEAGEVGGQLAEGREPWRVVKI